jgi:hypothetical protein
MQPLNAVVSPEGKLPPYISKLAGERIAALSGKHIKIKIWAAEETPSDKQRKYYFAVIVHKFCQHYAGYSKDDMHNSLMRAVGGFNKPFVNALTGEEDEDRLSWNDLSVKQAEGYMTLCRKRAAEKGFNVPEPHEDEAKWLMDNYNQ